MKEIKERLYANIKGYRYRHNESALEWRKIWTILIYTIKNNLINFKMKYSSLIIIVIIMILIISIFSILSRPLSPARDKRTFRARCPWYFSGTYAIIFENFVFGAKVKKWI